MSNRGTQKDVFVIELAGAQRAHVFPRLNFFPNLTVQEKKNATTKNKALEKVPKRQDWSVERDLHSCFTVAIAPLK